ncbi:MAG: SLC13 family permease [Chloroflexota bacterium]
MSFEMGFTLALLGVALVLFVTEWLRVDVVAFGVLVALMLSGVLTTSEALAGFSNSTVITILALFIVGGAVLQTGLAALIGRRILDVAGTGETRLMIVIMVAVALLSGFMSDTGTVAVLLPAVIGIAATAGISPSKLLMPLSFGALLGGAMTLIGTPPNIYVSDLLAENGMQPFGFFSYTPVGLLLLLAGVVFMLTLGRRLLPSGENKIEPPAYGDNPEELLDLYLSKQLEGVRVSEGSPLVEQTIAETRFHRDHNLTVVEILRNKPQQELISIGGQKLVRVEDGQDRLMPRGNTRIQTGDVLLLQGDATDIAAVRDAYALERNQLTDDVKQSIVNENFGIAEVILRPRSKLVGRSLSEIRFGSRFKLTVLDIIRPDQSKLDMRSERLRFGDTLLVQGYWDDILALRERPHDFIVTGDIEGAARAENRRRAPVAAAILGAMLLALIFGEDLLVRLTGNPALGDIINTASISMTAALAMVLTGCLTMDDAYDAIDWRSIILIAGMIPMSTALQKVGLATAVADGFIAYLGPLGPYAILAGLFLLTSLFTQVISNTATTVILAPIALTIALQYDVRPQPFLMGVAIAASMAFASPVASPVNTLVMSAGGYSFRDYLKIGLPMILVMLIVTMIFVPILFPFG